MNKSILFSNSARANCWGGVEKWVLVAAKALIGKGYQVHLLCRKNSIIEKKAIAQGISTVSIGYTNSTDICSVIRIYRSIKKFKADAIICSTNLDIKLAGLAAKIAHTPVISRQGLSLITNKLKYKILIKYFTDSIITNTYSIKNEYEDFNWFPQDHIKVIYNCVETDTIETSRAKINELKEKHKIRQNQKVLLSAGRLSEQKGFCYLVEAARKAQTANKDWLFLIVGNGNLCKKLTDQIEKYKLKNIRLLGFQNNMKEFYALADLFILPSLREGTPNVVLEAMANKLAVIATNVNGVSEIMESGEHGIIIPPRDASAIYEAIELIVNDQQRQQYFIDNSYRNIRENFSFEKFTENFTSYLEEVIGKYKIKN